METVHEMNVNPNPNPNPDSNHDLNPKSNPDNDTNPRLNSIAGLVTLTTLTPQILCILLNVGPVKTEYFYTGSNNSYTIIITYTIYHHIDRM